MMIIWSTDAREVVLPQPTPLRQQRKSSQVQWLHRQRAHQEWEHLDSVVSKAQFSNVSTPSLPVISHSISLIPYDFSREREKKKIWKKNNKRRLSWDDGGNESSTHRFESVWNKILTAVTSLKKSRRISMWIQSDQLKFCSFTSVIFLLFDDHHHIVFICCCAYKYLPSFVMCYTHVKCETVRTSLSANEKKRIKFSS